MPRGLGMKVLSNVPVSRRFQTFAVCNFTFYGRLKRRHDWCADDVPKKKFPDDLPTTIGRCADKIYSVLNPDLFKIQLGMNTSLSS